MGRFEELTGLLAGLKGAPASVLWALSLAGRPLSQSELLLLTGYSEKPVRRAVRALLAQGIICHEGPRVLALAEDWATQTTSQKHGAAAPAEAAGHGRRDQKSRRSSRASGTSDDQHVVVAEIDPDPVQIDQQQQQDPEEAAHLAALLRRMGINGRAFQRLAARNDLAARPEVVLAWWWYYRSQEGVRNPAGAAISRLDGRDQPPEGYLALAKLWPGLTDDVREELESMVLYNWSAEQIAARLRPDCPGVTVGAVLAFMALSLEELEG
jgi:hypothetical protein